MVEAQNGSCALFGCHIADIDRLHVDHDHATGVVRGLLCSGCNTGLGKLRDSVDGLQQAIKYLQSST